ncbi:MAG: hypothetical protein SFU98_10935 [Leptospiraceae bacterium]|nr:hypothetical protein [Leptospiraceae bacterium]
MKILLILLYILLSYDSIFSETYSDHRKDDLLYWNGGKKTLEFLSRKETTTGKQIFQNGQLRILNRKLINTSYYTQKGGEDREGISRYSGFGRLDLELGLLTNNFFLIVSSKPNYKEEKVYDKEIQKKSIREVIIGTNVEYNNFKFYLQGGEGFQRLDSYGLFFSGYSRFVESSIHYLPFGITMNFFQIARTDDLRKRITGASLSFFENFFIKRNTFTYSSYIEDRILGIPQTILNERRDEEPKGEYRYFFWELETNPIKNFTFELGVFGVKGKRVYSNPFYIGNSPQIATDGRLYYAKLNSNITLADISIGGLYSRKDRSRNDSENNGYSGISTSPRIFGGASSFLLNLESNLIDRGVFSNSSTPEFQNKGIQMVSFEISKKFSESFGMNFFLNRGIVFLGNGYEGIVQGIYKNSYGFFLISYTHARLRSQDISPVLTNTIGVLEKEKAFDRFYLSAVLEF